MSGLQDLRGKFLVVFQELLSEALNPESRGDRGCFVTQDVRVLPKTPGKPVDDDR